MRSIYLITLLGLLSCSYQSKGYRGHRAHNDKPPIGRPGACYAKCLVPDEYEEYEKTFPIYEGDLPDTVDLVDYEYEISPSIERWEKRKADRNCLSADPNDCLVWCLINIPAKVEVIENIVVDTFACRDFILVEYNGRRLIKEGGFTEWREVVCEKDIDSSLILDIHDALFEDGYDPGRPSDKLNSSIKAALSQFQKDFNLPIGQLDLETLDALGVEY